MCFVTFSWGDTDSVKKIVDFEKSSEPKWAEVDITTRCNLDCEWCYLSCSRNKSGEDMDPEDFSRITDTLKKSGITQITISGGEPLLHPHVIDFVRLAADSGFVTHMNSNGWLMSGEMAKRLGAAGLTQVQMNIDHTDPVAHDAIRGADGSFGRAIRAFRNVREAGMKAVSQTVLTRRNADVATEIMDFSRKMGADRVRFWDMVPSGSAEGMHEMVPQDYSSILDAIARHAVRLGATGIISYEPLFPSRDYGIEVHHLPCPAKLGSGLVVKTNGDVKYCCTNDHVMYNILGISDIRKVHRDAIKSANSRLVREQECSGCSLYRTCLGGCPSRYAEHGDIQCIKNFHEK